MFYSYVFLWFLQFTNLILRIIFTEYSQWKFGFRTVWQSIAILKWYGIADFVRSLYQLIRSPLVRRYTICKIELLMNIYFSHRLLHWYPYLTAIEIFAKVPRKIVKSLQFGFLIKIFIYITGHLLQLFLFSLYTCNDC